MKKFDYETAINQLGLGKGCPINNINTALIPQWVGGGDFVNLYLPYLCVIGDSREQDRWIESACKMYGIAYKEAVKTKDGNENLKEGDYTFEVVFENKTYSYIGKVAYERKGSISEFYNNCTGYNKEKGTSDRDRIKAEFDRFNKKGYDKVVLMLQFGECLTDLIGLTFEYRGAGGELISKSTNRTLFSSVMSWRQPNNKNFDILQSDNRKKLFWLFLQDTYYYFRNELKKECIERRLLEND